MEDQLIINQLSWEFCSNQEGIEDLKQTLLSTTMELETTLISAEEEITKREIELNHLKDVLRKTMEERDEARSRCRELTSEKFALERQNKQETGSVSGVCSSDDESNSDMSLVSLPRLSSSVQQEVLKLAADRPLPEKGRLLQAVKDAGPLLGNILLAGPLPQWRHPPPQIATIEIPPVAICSRGSLDDVNGCLSKKRGPENYEGFEYCPNTKYNKVALHSRTTPDPSIRTRT